MDITVQDHGGLEEVVLHLQRWYVFPVLIGIDVGSVLYTVNSTVKIFSNRTQPAPTAVW